MNVRLAAAVLMVLLWSSVSAPTAETHPLPPTGVFYPESVDQAVLHDAAVCVQSNSLPGLPSDAAGQLEATVKSLGSFSPQAILPSRPTRKPSFVAKLKDYPGVARQFNEALKLLNEEKVPEWVSGPGYFKKSVSYAPSEYIMLYLVFDDANQPAAARAFLDKAVFAYATDPEPWVFLGEIAIDENRIAEAENDFNRAKRLLADYKNADRNPSMEKRVSRGLAEIAKVRNKLFGRESPLRLGPEESYERYEKLKDVKAP